MRAGSQRRHWWERVGLGAGMAGLLAVYAVTAGPAAASPPTVAPQASALTASADGQEPIRQTEADSLAQAVAIGQRVEIGAFRGESREVYANPDGTTTEVQHTQPVRVVRDGRWVPVDDTLVRAPDGSVGPRAATLGMRLSGGGDQPLIRAERAGRVMTLDWPGKLPAPVVDGDQATYPEVLPGVDLVAAVAVTGFSHVLVIKTPEAAADPALAELKFDLSTKGLDVRVDDEGGLAAVDTATGGAVLEANTPFMWDSGTPVAETQPQRTKAASAVGAGQHSTVQAPAASANRAQVGVKLTAGKLTLLPDKTMLTSPDTRWPVYIDPVWQDTRNSGWTMVDSGYRTQEYWKFKKDEGVGLCPVDDPTCNSSKVKRTFYALPTPYAGKTILSAEFSVTMTRTYSSTAKPVQLYLSKAGISKSTNWNNQPGLESEPQDTKSPTNKQSSCTATNQNVAFNATQAVITAASKKWSTTTFALKASNEDDDSYWKQFCGNAILSVNYNRAPATPLQSKLTMNPGGACVSGDKRPFVDTPPVLNAVLTDPDHSSAHTEQLRAEFMIYWTPAGGTQQTRTYSTGKLASGSRFSYNTAGLKIPENVLVAWEVRAHDDRTVGPWSWAGDQTRCEFVIDKTTPTAPDVDSPEYLPLDAADTTASCVEDDEWHGSIGTYSTFTFDSPATDVVEYRYGLNTNPSPNNVLTPETDGGPVTLRWMPETDGPQTISVQAVDRAKRSSVIASCMFAVAVRPAAGTWGLGEAAGASFAADASGSHPATPGVGAVFGVSGPACQNAGTNCQIDRAVRLSSAEDSFLATAGSVIDSNAGFAVAAWVRLGDDSCDRVAVSQDGSGEPGFTLGLDGATKKWSFRVPVNDVDSLGEWVVSSTATAAKNEWTHLAAVYDPEKRNLQLFVNGDVQPSAPRRSAWKSRGPLQLGRAAAKGGYRDHWVGDLADVTVFDRLIVRREVDELAKLRPVRLAYWPLDTAANGRSPEYGGEDSQDLLLRNGVSLYQSDPADPLGDQALIGAGHVVLDGADDHAYTESPVAVTNGSFTVSARVRLASDRCQAPMTVVAQSGATTSAFRVGCANNQWRLVMPHSDVAGGQATTVYDDQQLPSSAQSGQHLAVVYNALVNEVRLYVDGQLLDTAVSSHPASWQAGGGLQLGRALVDGSYGEYFAGAIDDVRVYTGVADADLIQLLARRDSQPDT